VNTTSRKAATLEEVRSLLFDNWPYKVITLCFAMLTWAYVQSEQIVEEHVRVRIEWTMPDGLVAVETPLEYATVTVAGVQALMRNMRPVDLVLPVDLSGAREGDATIDLADRPIRGLPSEVRVVSVNPGTLRVELDRMLKRRVKVTPALKGDPAEGFVVKQVSVSPDHVDISGPAKLVRALTDVTTEDVDVTGLHEDAELEVGLGLSKSSAMRVVRPGPIAVSIHVSSTIRERLFDAVPVVVRGDRYVASSSVLNVSVEGPEALVGALKADDLSVMVYAPPEFTDAEGDAVEGPDGLRFEVLGVEPPLRVSRVNPATVHVIAKVTP